MAAVVQAESTLTERYQTTVPETVRRALGLNKRDKLHYDVLSTGEVVLSRSESKEYNDPALGSFLDFLAQDIAAHPERLQGIDTGLVKRLNKLVGKVKVDLDATLSADDE